MQHAQDSQSSPASPMMRLGSNSSDAAGRAPVWLVASLLLLLLAAFCIPLWLNGDESPDSGDSTKMEPVKELGEALPDSELHLVVLHTNDVHGQVLPRLATWKKQEVLPEIGGLPRVAAFFTKTRREHRGTSKAVLALDGGDWYQGTPEGLLDEGHGFVSALAATGYDGLAMGNHELDHGLENAAELCALLGGRALCANLAQADGSPVDWVQPYRIVKVKGLRFALVGFLTTTTPTISHEDARTRLSFRDPVEVMGELWSELQERADFVIPVSHLGTDEDQRLAKAFPEIPLIVGGHYHRFLNEGLREGSTLIVQAGSKASSVGWVELKIDLESKRVIESSARLVELEEAPEERDRVAAVERLCDGLVERAAVHMNEVVGILANPLNRARGLETSPSGAWIADVMRARTGADVALQNRGGVRTAIPAGDLRRRDLFELCPFDNYLITSELTGSELLACLGRAFSSAHTPLDPSGVRIFVKRVQNAEGKSEIAISRLEIAGAPLDPKATYTVTSNSFMAEGGDGYEELAVGRERVIDSIVLRNLLEQEAAEHSPIDPPTDARWIEE